MVFVSDICITPQIFIRDLSSGDMKQLTYSSNYNTTPVLSPKGDHCLRLQDRGTLESAYEIGQDRTTVLTDSGVNDSPQFLLRKIYPVLSDNGRRLPSISYFTAATTNAFCPLHRVKRPSQNSCLRGDV
jgi:hypothetical protein